jgi:hypothetical protein
LHELSKPKGKKHGLKSLIKEPSKTIHNFLK